MVASALKKHWARLLGEPRLPDHSGDLTALIKGIREPPKPAGSRQPWQDNPSAKSTHQSQASPGLSCLYLLWYLWFPTGYIRPTLCDWETASPTKRNAVKAEQRVGIQQTGRITAESVPFLKVGIVPCMSEPRKCLSEKVTWSCPTNSFTWGGRPGSLPKICSNG